MRVVLSFLIGFFCSLQVQAYERIDNVYEGLIPLSDRSEAVRNQAIRDGLEQVLIRYTGYSAITSIPEIANELNSAQRYVIEYGVETIDVESEDQLGKVQQDALWVRYNEGLINQLANSYELPIWPTLRPTLAYTVVTELWGEAHLPTTTEYPALWLHLDALFNERGLKTMPLYALDLKSLSANDLWRMDQPAFAELKSRVSGGADISLVIRVRGQQDAGYELDFLFVEESSETLIKKTGRDLRDVLDDGIDTYIDRVSTDLAFLGGTELEKDLHVQIEGMRSFSEYRKLMNQIAGLEQVVSVRMENATDTGIGYLIRYQSDQVLLIESISEITGIKRLSEIRNQPSLTIFPGSKDNPIYFLHPNPAFTLWPEKDTSELPRGFQG